MSGTSLDGVDAVLADFSSERPHVLAHSTAAFDAALHDELLALNTPGENELHRAWLAGNALARTYAEAVRAVLQAGNVSASAVRAIGAHGQTVRHRPQEFDGIGYTIQLNQPALLAELTGIDVVADFRSRDVAAGGQGAPLVPPFHRKFFGSIAPQVGVLNIGGISNITLIDSSNEGVLLGFDCGPGNALMDAWCKTHTGEPFDRDGAWATGGNVITTLLAKMLDEPFFARKPPKSTGRDLFNWPWLQDHLRSFEAESAQDVQATLTELTARACAQSALTGHPRLSLLIVCGGGALNGSLMHRLAAQLPACQVVSSAEYGLPPLQVEATAFAWLAQQAVERKSSSVKEVTGAAATRVLGGIYPA